MPLYGSQTLTNSPLQACFPGDVNEVLAFNAEIPVAQQASIAIPIAIRPFMNGPANVSIQVEGALGSGVLQVQYADNDVAGDYVSIPFGGASPGVINAAAQNASNVARVELLIAARFVRILCTTTVGNAITVRVRQR